MPIRRRSGGSGTAYFQSACGGCPLRARCTTSPDGRTVEVGIHEASLAAARARQESPGWLAHYRTVRSIVERKVAHTPVAGMGAGSPACADVSRSTPTTTCSLLPSTWRDWRRWACMPHQPGGRSQRPTSRGPAWSSLCPAGAGACAGSTDHPDSHSFPPPGHPSTYFPLASATDDTDRVSHQIPRGAPGRPLFKRRA